jgi:uncharacterized protein
LPDGRTLAEELSPPVYARLSNHVTSAGMPMLMFDHLKPAMAAMTLEVLEMQSLGAMPEYGVDQYFFNRARKAGKQMMPLETVQFQIDLVTSLTREEGELLLKTTLQDLDKTRSVLGDMISSWENGDAAKLGKLMNETMRESPALFRKFVTDRNDRWVPKIELLLRGEKNAMVIVGAGHLVGEQGVIEQLKKKGWKITQL